MFESPLLHVGLLVIRETQKTEDAVLERRHFELSPKLLFTRVEGAEHGKVGETRLLSHHVILSI